MYKCPYCKAELDDIERDMVFVEGRHGKEWEPTYGLHYAVDCPECGKKIDYIEVYEYIGNLVIPWEE